MRKIRTYIILIASACLLAYVLFPKPKPPAEPITENIGNKELQLTPKNFSDLAAWQTDNLAATIPGFKDSCRQILKETSEFLSYSLAQVPTAKYQEICNKFLSADIKSDKDFRAFIEANFTPYLVSSKNNEFGKFTSYYESALNASFTKSAKYKYPVYGKPNDLIEFNIKDFDEAAPSKRYVGRINGQKLVPYYSRAEIAKKPLDAPVILWGDDPIDIYIMQIQGSAIATLPDGSQVQVGYADNNGHPFRGIASILLEKKLLKSGETSMGQVKKWLKKNGKLALDNMNENKRFVFHRIIGRDSGPIGAHGVPLTPGRSLAVDRSFIPMGALLWLETTGPDANKIERLVIAQDVGGAIKGAIRGDYFWGSGDDEVLDKAGRMNATGRYFILLPK